MAAIDSHAHISIIINGHRFTTFADDDPPYMIDANGDSAEFKTGQDGKLFGLALAEFGGTLTIRLAPFSPSVQWCVKRENERKQRLIDEVQAQTFSGTLTNTTRGIDASLKGGLMQNFPMWPTANQTYEAVFRFERIISNIDGGAFGQRFNEQGF